MNRQIIEASKGNVLTDGEVYGKKIYLATDEDKSKFYEITDEEYWELMAESEESLND